MTRGFTQRGIIDYNDVFSPSVQHRSIRMLLAMIVELNFELEEMDVRTAFLYGKLEKKISTGNNQKDLT